MEIRKDSEEIQEQEVQQSNNNQPMQQLPSKSFSVEFKVDEKGIAMNLYEPNEREYQFNDIEKIGLLQSLIIRMILRDKK